MSEWDHHIVNVDIVKVDEHAGENGSRKRRQQEAESCEDYLQLSIEKHLDNADTLRSILQHQRGVHYLQGYLPDVGDHHHPIDAATFRRSVPLSCYDDYADYINQLADGHNYSVDHDPRHILSVDPLDCFFYSSGTSTMKPKLIPYFDSALSKAASQIAHQGSAAVLRRISDSVHVIHASYAIGLIKALRVLESKWEQLCDDLEKGSPCAEIKDVQMRDSVVEVLGGPQPDMSIRFRSIFETKDWSGILHKLWSNVRYIKCVTTGSMKQYYSKLKYYAGEVPLVGGDYFSSECCVAINLDIKQPPDQTRFVMLPTAAYFEFLPFDSAENNVVGEETVDVCGAEIGKMYEVVVTTYRGFYRYRLGDIVRVAGFYNSSPLLEFVMRAPKTSYEIVTEGDLMAAMETFQLVLRNTMSMGMAIEIMEFTSSTDFGSSPKRLKIFIEPKDCDTSLQYKLQESIVLLGECCYSLEEGLGSMYKVQRNKGDISPLSVSILKCGSFDRLLKLATENGTPASQYKSPKVI
ncbi:hypothetical protein V6N12_053984 [Hibiscus sabdariffa]|uniref:Indole-3-acetic acid-amido synthetase GH3.6 n=1 Tax=Hibiscus sabdariffa TaxID=183260 RepID=A0ABR2D962_9ROSI